ncbi:hypothetical protein [Bacillus massilioanorexius]|uniref:hypothetical protein n=1 Tax=Bacillus massilioanorexius TaxID=1468413 RepID=UPI0002FD949C|nr:hypothetical protein [Bacillus massilioanorexius]
MAFEEDVLGLFDCNEVYPGECYWLENIPLDYFLQEPSPFIEILWNENKNEFLLKLGGLL